MKNGCRISLPQTRSILADFFAFATAENFGGAYNNGGETKHLSRPRRKKREAAVEAAPKAANGRGNLLREKLPKPRKISAIPKS